VPEAIQTLTDFAIQIHGGGGLSSDHPLSAMWAAARTLRYEATPLEVPPDLGIHYFPPSALTHLIHPTRVHTPLTFNTPLTCNTPLPLASLVDGPDEVHLRTVSRMEEIRHDPNRRGKGSGKGSASTDGSVPGIGRPRL
jgi:hypothetical protein